MLPSTGAFAVESMENLARESVQMSPGDRLGAKCEQLLHVPGGSAGFVSMGKRDRSLNQECAIRSRVRDIQTLRSSAACSAGKNPGTGQKVQLEAALARP